MAGMIIAFQLQLLFTLILALNKSLNLEVSLFYYVIFEIKMLDYTKSEILVYSITKYFKILLLKPEETFFMPTI